MVRPIIFASVFDATTEPQQHEGNVHDGHVYEGLPDTFHLQLNGDISHITKAINHLKQNKAGGAYTLISEVFMYSAEIITPFLVGLSN